MSQRDELERAAPRAGAGLDDGTRRSRRGGSPSGAASEGTARIAYATLDTPVGDASIAATPRGVALRRAAHRGRSTIPRALAERVSPADRRGAGTLDAARRELEEYFDGRRRDVRPAPRLAARPGRLLPQGAATRRRGSRYGVKLTYGEIAAQGRKPRGRTARPAPRSGRTRCRSSFPATASSGAGETPATTAAAPSSRGGCCASKGSARQTRQLTLTVQLGCQVGCQA